MSGRKHDWVEGHIVSANLYLQLSDWQSAHAILAERYPGPIDRDVGGFPSARTGYAFALQQTSVNDRFDALYDASLEEANRRIDAGHESPTLRIELAAIHAVRGEAAEAAEWLDRSYDLGHREARILEHPMFAIIRDDPCCQRIVADVSRAMRVPSEWN